MAEERSIEYISVIISNKVKMMLIEMLPEPSCPRKKDQNNWKREQVINLLLERLKKNDK
jgi:hypothetical protein